MDITRYFKTDTIGQDSMVAIFLPSSYLPSEEFVASELANALNAITGVHIPIRKSDALNCEKETLSFLIGTSLLSDKIKKNLKTLEENELEIKCIDENIVLLRGGSERSTIYAVYELLDSLGCRWFHPDETYLPEFKKINIPDDYLFKPGFAYRDNDWNSTINSDLWAVRNRLNGSNSGIRNEYGGHKKWDPFLHSFHKIIPSDEYGKSHPEYFSFRTGQGWITSGGQLCLSNPDVFNLLTEFTLRRMAMPDVKIVDISQNDCANPCQCPECAERDRKAGSHAASVLNMCNRIADVTSKQYPEKFVGTLAYTYTKTPPKELRAHDNVIVRLCHMGDYCDSHPLATCKLNKAYIDLIAGWRKIAKHVYIWHYVTNFQHSLLFHPCFDALSQDIRFYQEQKIAGLYLQAFSTKGVAFAEVHAYAMARCMWNPARDYMTEVEAFVKAFYGNGGQYIHTMIQVLQENARNGFHSTLYTHPHEGLFTQAQLKKAGHYLNQAIKSIGTDEKYLNRLEAVKMWLNYAKITAIPPLEKREEEFLVQAAPEADLLFSELKSIMKRQQVDITCEFPSTQQDLSERFGWSLKTHSMPLAVLENDLIRIEVCPELGGMMCSLIDKKSGIDLLCKPAPWILCYPYMGGFLEGIDTHEGIKGVRQNYSISEKETNDVSIVIKATINNSLDIRRTFTLGENAPFVQIETEYFNKSNKALEIKPHSYLLSKCGQLKDLKFFKQDNSDELLTIETDSPESSGITEAQWINLRGENTPENAWGYYNAKLKIGLCEKFTNKPLFCGSNAYLRDQHILMETQASPITIKPLDSIKHVMGLSINK